MHKIDVYRVSHDIGSQSITCIIQMYTGNDMYNIDVYRVSHVYRKI